jgi:ABC-type Fe3+ transport system permease subunit
MLPAVAAIIVVPPSEVPIDPPRLSLIASTLGWSMAVAVLSTAIGVIVAPALANGSRVFLAIAAWPLLVPSYFAYSGLSVLRAPGSMLGDYLAARSAEGASAAASFVASLFALLGLVLWIWPLPAFLIAVSIRSAGSNVRDALKLDAGPCDRFIESSKMLGPAILGSAAIVTVVMLGSPVPFHLAQVRTLAIAAWLEIQRSASPVSAWIIMSPIIMLATIGAIALASKIRAITFIAADAPAARERVTIGQKFVLCGTVIVSCLLPAALFARSIRDPLAITQFFALNLDALVSGLATAAFCVLGGLMFFTWFALCASRRSKSVTIALAILIGAGLTPGILIGSVWSVVALRLPAWFADSIAPIGLAHLARFGMIAAIAGCFAGALESRESREQRAIDGADTIVGYLRARFRDDGPLAFGAALLMGVFSLYEIESAVLVQPPGLSGLAARMLNDLHQLRMDSVSAAALWLWIVGSIPILAASWLIRRRS